LEGKETGLISVDFAYKYGYSCSYISGSLKRGFLEEKTIETYKAIKL